MNKELIEYLKRNRITKLYHATYKPAIDSIKAHGLGATPPERINAWEGLSQSYVYLAHSPDLALGFAEAADNYEIPNDWRWEMVVLSVHLSEIDLSRLEFDSNNQMEEPDRTFQYKGIINWAILSLEE